MEEWRDVRGYEGLYQVSSIGRVRSLNYNRTGKSKIIKQAKNSRGYLIVGLHKDGTQKIHSVHRLIAEAFIENPFNKPIIDHINTIRTDNRIENLRWCSQKENCNNELTKLHHSEVKKGIYLGENNPMYGKQHSEETKQKMSEAKKRGKNYKSKTVEVLKDGVSLAVFSCTRELERQSEELFGTKLFSSAVSAVCLGKKRQYKGYTFKYVD